MDSEDRHIDPLKEGIAAAIAEKWERARRFLWQAVHESPQNEVAWLWLSKVSENLDEHEFSLARALALNPENLRTRFSLEISRADPESSARPPARGRCLICGRAYAEVTESCARCRCVTSFDNPERFLRPLGVERGLVREALKRLDAGVVKNEEKRLRILALARLNLGEPCQALPALLALAARRPNDARLCRLIEVIGGQLADIQIESGFETEAVERPSCEELGISNGRSLSQSAT